MDNNKKVIELYSDSLKFGNEIIMIDLINNVAKIKKHGDIYNLYFSNVTLSWRMYEADECE